MSVTATNATSGPFVPNGVTTAFPFTFAVGSASELKVLIDGTESSDSLYTVTLNDPDAAIHEGGTVTFSIAPTGAELVITSDPDFDQDIAFTNSGPFLAESHDEANDRAAIRDIYLKSRADELGSDLDDAEATLDAEIDARIAGDAALAQVLATAVIEASAGPIPELKIKTPFMFGALGQGVDDTVALQAFFDDARDPANAILYVYDFSGEWLVSDTIYAVYWDGHEPNVDRRFICGTLRFASVVSLPGSVPLEFGMEIAGLRCTWEGTLALHSSAVADSQYFAPYALRPYRVGLRRRMCSGSKFGTIIADDAQIIGVRDDSTQGTFTYRAGTAYETTLPNATNIAMDTTAIIARYCGSNSQQGTGAASQAVVLKEQGYSSTVTSLGFAENFVASVVAVNERTRVQIADTSPLEVWSYVWSRLELLPAIYGTIAADSGTKTITWSAGDPTAYFDVGDRYPSFAGGPNANIVFHITGFSGTSNRVIAVDVAPTSHAATADAGYWQFSRPSFHIVAWVEDSTHFTVFPLIPDRNNSNIYFATGAGVWAEGSDTANSRYGTIVGLGCGAGLHLAGLYQPKIGNLLSEACGVGLALGQTGSAILLGTNIEHAHFEGNAADLVVIGGAPGRICPRSNFDFDKVHMLAGRALIDSNSQENYPLTIGGDSLQIESNGLLYQGYGHALYPYEGTSGWATYYGISNSPADREIYLHADGPLAMEVSYDQTVSRLFSKNHWARAIWTSASGAAPTGTLTFTLSAALIGGGWTFAGAGSGTSYAITAPGKTIVLELQYLFATKKVAITRLNGA